MWRREVRAAAASPLLREIAALDWERSTVHGLHRRQHPGDIYESDVRRRSRNLATKLKREGKQGACNFVHSRPSPSPPLPRGRKRVTRSLAGSSKYSRLEVRAR